MILILSPGKRRDIEYEEEDSNIDCAENVAGALQLHQLKVRALLKRVKDVAS